MTYVNRTLEKVLLRASKRFKVIMVTGIRQSGKSTLLKHLSDRTYVSLDNIKALDTVCRSDEFFFSKTIPLPFLLKKSNGRLTFFCRSKNSLIITMNEDLSGSQALNALTQ